MVAASKTCYVCFQSIESASVCPRNDCPQKRILPRVATLPESATDELLLERGKTNGDYKQHARITQSLKGVMHPDYGWSVLSPPQRESLDMIAHKIGRILAGNPNHEDHWVDIAGYATLIVQQLKEPQPR